ncbi:MAG: hypothetical protein JKY37_21445 [Nannocystaceae bacterium]|nr:hypothetical protein [Nannocystaceae bacterium]
MTEKRIHLDELEYTSEGLRSRGPIDLRVGVHNKIVIVRPKRVRAVAVGYGSFSMDSAFPGPGVLMLGLRVALQDLNHTFFGGGEDGIYQFFGHAEPSGDEAYNKGLSDRRAKAVRAFFVGDIAAVQEMATNEGWSTKEHQIMLRVLRCDPGAIDGELGPYTEFAVELFQREYADGVFHRHIEGTPQYPALSDDGKLNKATVDALVESFVVATSPQLAQQQLHPSHPVVGCSEFNQVVAGDPVYNRRVALVVHDVLPKFHDKAPCVAGDHSVCPIDNRDALSSCLWYREHVSDPPVEALIHRHFDLRWLEVSGNKVLLSALTTLPDESEVVFQVFKTQPIASADAIAPSTLGSSLSESLTGIVRAGVAQVVWDPPEHFSLHAIHDWIVPVDIRDSTRVRGTPRKSCVPVFRIEGGGAEALSPTPGRELARVPRELPDTSEPLEIGLSAVDAFGRVFQHASHQDGRSQSQRHPLHDDEPRVLLTRHATLWHGKG